MLFACLSQFSDSKGQRFESPGRTMGSILSGAALFLLYFHPVGIAARGGFEQPGPAACVPAGPGASTQNGLAYTAQNIDSLLAHRMKTKSSSVPAGTRKGPVKRTREQDEAFVVVPGKMLWI